MSLAAPFAGFFHSYSHSRQHDGAICLVRFASAQVLPPSVLTSTFATSPVPVHAAPTTFSGLPAATTSWAAGRAICDFTWSSVTGVIDGNPPSRRKYV